MSLNKLYRKIVYGKPKFLTETKYSIKEAFELGGVMYYEMENLYNLPYLRGCEALTFYEELRHKCDSDYLKKHCEAKKKLRSNPKQIDLGAMFQLDQHLEERLTMIPHPDMIYKLASVVFFDSSENPTVYDHAYGQKKIKFWKEHQGAKDFFLREPMVRLMPFLKDSAEDILTSSIQTQQRMRYHQEYLLSLLSSKELTREQLLNLFSENGHS